MRSHAALSSNKPPMTDCSASMECGGTFSASSWGSFDGAFMRRNYRRNDGRRRGRKNKKGGNRSRFPPFFYCGTTVASATGLSPAAHADEMRLTVFAQHRNRHVENHVDVQ